jgi:hypothetical protein
VKLPIFLTFCIASWLACVTNAQAADIGFELSTGLSTSGDYTDSIEKAYEDVYEKSIDSGLGIFYEIGAAMPVGIAENIVVKPKISLLMGFVSIEVTDSAGSTKDIELKINTVFIPAIATEYHLNGYKEPSFFFGGEIGFPIISGGDDEYYELENDGISFGFYCGYAFKGGVKISIGYRSIPAEITYFPNLIEYKETKNFGGVSFQFAYKF